MQRKQELFIIIGFAIFLQIKENLETPALLLAETTAVNNFPTVLNTVIFEYLNILLPTETAAVSLEPEDTISFSIDIQNHHSNVNLPETQFTVPSSIGTNVLTLFNRNYKNSARLVQSTPVVSSTSSATNPSSTEPPKTFVVSIDNSRLLEPSFLSDVRHMLTLFADNTLNRHRAQLDPVLTQFIRTVKRLLQQEHIHDDLKRFYCRGSILQHTLMKFIEYLVMTRVRENHEKLRAWTFIDEIELYCNDSKREEHEIVFDIEKYSEHLTRKKYSFWRSALLWKILRRNLINMNSSSYNRTIEKNSCVISLAYRCD